MKDLNEVAPPGWGHTKAEKEKTKPNKPKSKIGGTAHEFKKDLESGKFKGLPGDKTKKDREASMFKLMWSMKKKGYKPHYKPGEKDVLKKQYKDRKEELQMSTRYSKTMRDAYAEALTFKQAQAKDKKDQNKDPVGPTHEDSEIEEGGAYGGGLKDAAKKVKDAEKRLGIEKDKTTVTKTKHGEVRKTTYKGKIDMGQKREEVEQSEANLPPHLSKFFDKKGNPTPDAAKRMADGQKKREVKYKTKDVTPKGYGPNEDVEIDELSNKTLSSYSAKADKSQADAEKKGDYKTADKRIVGKMAATRKKFSNDMKKWSSDLDKSTKKEDWEPLRSNFLDEAEWKVKQKGLPALYVPGKSASADRQM